MSYTTNNISVCLAHQNNVNAIPLHVLSLHSQLFTRALSPRLDARCTGIKRAMNQMSLVAHVNRRIPPNALRMSFGTERNSYMPTSEVINFTCTVYPFIYVFTLCLLVLVLSVRYGKIRERSYARSNV